MKSSRELKPSGKTFKVIKYKRSDYDQYIKYEGLDQVDDIYMECNDGWFQNMRNQTRTDILNVENYQEFYQEFYEEVVPYKDGISKQETEVKRDYINLPELDMMVYHDEIYKGHELMKIVGICKTEVELEGDYSGGTHAVIQKDWYPLKGTFRLRKVCDERKNPKGCQLHNLHCAYPDCEPFVEINKSTK